MTEPLITMGVDVGQVRDPTAIAVAEAVPQVNAGRTEAEERYIVRHLERLPLGTAYPQVAARIAAIATKLRARAGQQAVPLFIDATGVGRRVADLLTQAGVTPCAVSFVAGVRLTVRADGSIALGKEWLVSRLQALLHAGRLSLPHTADARALASELLTYEIRVAQDGGTTCGAFKAGTHDDLATALGLAVLGKGSDRPARSGARTAQEKEKEKGGMTRWDQSRSA